MRNLCSHAVLVSEKPILRLRPNRRGRWRPPNRGHACSSEVCAESERECPSWPGLASQPENDDRRPPRLTPQKDQTKTTFAWFWQTRTWAATAATATTSGRR